jgi:hypothetical protein
MFTKYIIKNESNIFNQLSSIDHETICKGRQGAIIVSVKNNLIPIVRTTTIYQNPAQHFFPIHNKLIDKIKKVSKINLEFNNGMSEIYDSTYTKMKEHTDQSLDLHDDSYICLFSCYDNPIDNLYDLRKLQIKNKITNENSEIELSNNSVVLFDTTTNKNHLHKIILDKKTTNNRWLGITFRLSKTFVKFINEIPYFVNGQILVLANDNERQLMYKCKSEENINVNYVYPSINFTISPSDLMNIK